MLTLKRRYAHLRIPSIVIVEIKVISQQVVLNPDPKLLLGTFLNIPQIFATSLPLLGQFRDQGLLPNKICLSKTPFMNSNMM